MYKSPSKSNMVAGNIGRAIGRGGKSLLRGTGRGLARGFKGMFRAIRRITKVKTVLIACGLLLGGTIIVTHIAYYTTDQNVGKTHNFIDYGNTVGFSSDGETAVENYSYANAACLSFYQLLSRNQSVWQEIEEDGKKILVRPNDERAVKDYFKGDEDFVFNEYLIYSLSNALYEDNYVYPEAFLKPVAYTSDYKLGEVLDENGNVKLQSKKIDMNTGRPQKDKDGKDILENSVADYGLATVLSYQEKERVETLEYTYVGESMWGEDGLIDASSYNEPNEKALGEFVRDGSPHSEVIDSHTEHILSHAVSFAGDITYEYQDTHTMKSKASGKGTSERDNAFAIDLGEVTEYYYACYPTGSGGSDTSSYKYGTDATALYEKYCKDGGYTMVGLGSSGPQAEPNYDDYLASNGGNESKAKRDYNKAVTEYEKSKKNFASQVAGVEKVPVTYNKILYRDSNAGIYEDFCRNSNRKVNDTGSEYLYEYLNHFETNAPDVSRSYDTFRGFTSSAIGFSGISSVIDMDGGGYYGDKISLSPEAARRAEYVWDCMRVWGYSEEQCAAALGNFYYEGGASFDFGSLELENQIGHGLAQYSYGSFYEEGGGGLKNFADYKHKGWDDPETQMQYTCIALDASHRYKYPGTNTYITGAGTPIVWWTDGSPTMGTKRLSQAEAREIWESKTASVEDKTYAMINCWEKPAVIDNHVKNMRSEAALFFFDLFHGRTPEATISVINPAEGGAKGTGDLGITGGGQMNEADKEAFASFYQAGLTNADEERKYKAYSHPLTRKEIDRALMMTNSLIESTDLATQQIKATEGVNLWDSGYLTKLAEDRNESMHFRIGAGVDFILPVAKKNASINSRFGFRDYTGGIDAGAHKGVDLQSSTGDPIYAPHDGTITATGYDGGMGNYVCVTTKDKEGHEITSTLMHNSVILDETVVGKEVKKGDLLSYAGSTGDSTGAHCHWGLSVDGVLYNPLVYCFGGYENITAIDNETNKVETVNLPPYPRGLYYLSWEGGTFTQSGLEE